MAPLDPEKADGLRPSACELLATVLSALQKRHQDGVTHGSLKPCHIFRAGLSEPRPGPPEPDPFSLLFQAPELNGTHAAEVGPPADLYSVGALLYFMLTGRAPFTADSVSQALRAPFLQPIPSLALDDDSLDLVRGLEAMMTKLLSIDPKDRYLSASEALADLALLKSSPTTFLAGAGEHRDILASPAFVGRSDLLHGLRRHLRQGGILQLLGEAGSGKSRLVKEMGRIARGQDLLILQSRARQQTAEVGLQVLDELCQDLLSQEGESNRRERILADLGVWRTVVCTALPTLGDPGESGPERYAWIRTRQALAHFIQVLGTSQKPALLIIEDLHWSPPDTLEILSAVKPSPNVTILVTSRGELSPLPGPRFQVPPLEQWEAERMARSMLGLCQTFIPERAAQACEGIPYRLASLLRGWCQDGSIRPSPTGWVAREDLSTAGPSEKPPSRELLQPATREVLSLAAVLGRQIELELLSCLVEPSVVRASLLEATELGFLQRTGPEAWIFTHELKREAVLSWEPSGLKEQHLRLARELCLHFPHREAEIAYHFYQAGEATMALPFARGAAASARKRHALSAAQTYLQFALAGAGEDASLWEDLGDVQKIAGHFQSAHQSYAGALALVSDPLARARLLGGQGETAFSAGQLDAARELLGEALALLGHSLPSGRRARNLALLRELIALAKPGVGAGALSEAQGLALKLLDLLAYVLAYSDGYGLIWANLRCLNLTRKAAPSREMGIALITHAVAVLYVPPLLSRSFRSADQAMELLEQFGTVHDRAGAMGRKGAICLFTGRPLEALCLYERAVPILKVSGDRYDAHLASYGLGLALYSLGRLQEARRVLKENLQDCVSLGDSLGCGSTLRVLGLLEPLSEELIESVVENPNFPSVRTLLAEVRGLNHLQQGEFLEAIAHLERGAEIARKGGDVLEALWSGCFLLQARRLQARREAGALRSKLELQAEKEGRRCLRLARKAYLLYLPRLCRELGLLKLDQGDFRAAAEFFEQGLAAARQAGMRYEEALSLWELAALPGLRGEEAREEATRIFTLIGSTWERSSLPNRHPGIALAERFDQVILWTQAIASKRSSVEVVEAARQAAEALLHCHCVRLPAFEATVPLPGKPYCSNGQAQRGDEIQGGQAEPRSILIIPLPLLGEQAMELCCSVDGVENFFGEEELRLAGLIQGQARTALTNAHLWAELQERETYLDQLFSSVPAGVAVIDGKGVVLQTNPRMLKMLGRCPLGNELVEMLQIDDRPWFELALRKLGNGESHQRELRVELPEGSLLWGELSLQPLAGGEGRAIVALSDVSERRLEQIAAFQERERSMVSSEVHDVLSQPLVGLHLGLEALSLQHPEAQTALRSAAQQARDVLNDTRELIARLRSPQIEKLCLSQSILEAVEELVHGPDVKVGVEVEPALDSLSSLATLFTYRMVVEALVNCKRHSCAGRVRVRLRLGQDHLHAIVADDGVGFAPHQVPGKHFGLRIVRERAELLGGRAKIRSAPGRGTVIAFKLPVKRS